jgi:ABC-2 type transport system permease protein
VSHANPILYMVNAFRYGFLGVSDVDIRLAYTMMIGAAVVLFTSCVWLLTRGVGTRE